MKAHNEILNNLNVYNKEIHNIEESLRWNRIYGKDRKTMDEAYERDIRNKLIPMLNNYQELKMFSTPTIDEPGYQVYNGYTKDNDRIDFKFIEGYKPTMQNRNGKYDITVIITFEGQEEIAGVINLKKQDYVDEAFEIITMTLERMGIIGEKQPEENKEDNSELDDLANFKKGLSEQELIEIEVR